VSVFDKGIFDLKHVGEVDSDEELADQRIVVYKVHHDVINVVFTEFSDEVLDPAFLEQQVLLLVDTARVQAQAVLGHSLQVNLWRQNQLEVDELTLVRFVGLHVAQDASEELSIRVSIVPIGHNECRFAQESVFSKVMIELFVIDFPTKDHLVDQQENAFRKVLPNVSKSYRLDLEPGIDIFLCDEILSELLDEVLHQIVLLQLVDLLLTFGVNDEEFMRMVLNPLFDKEKLLEIAGTGVRAMSHSQSIHLLVDGPIPEVDMSDSHAQLVIDLHLLRPRQAGPDDLVGDRVCAAVVRRHDREIP